MVRQGGVTRIWAECTDGLTRGLRRFDGYGHGFRDVTDRPMPSILAGRPARMVIEPGDAMEIKPTTKPPYYVPSMAEIAALPPNGLTAISTFSGCGGSSLGYRMAGYRVLWANEFVPAARDSYAANMAAGTILDPRDIRAIAPSDVLGAIGLKAGELDLFDGSPPCASFSTAGKREDSWGKVKAYSDKAQRSDDLFFELARLIRGIQPRVFVAENVSGLVKGTAKGYFLEILGELKGCGYRVAAKLLDAQWLGVPQARQRLIFIGVRNDIDRAPVHPRPLAYRYSVRDALPWIVSQADNGGFGGGEMRSAVVPSPTIGATSQTGNGKFPPALVEARITRLIGGNKAPFDSKGKVYNLDRPCPTVIGGDTLGLAPFQFIVETETDISRYAIGAEWDKLKPGGSTFYGARLWKPALSEPCPTVSQRGGDNTAASVCHPTEKRKFSIAELRRICGFPDDFVLTGTYAQQWERLGRAVPPVMMAHVAATIRDHILRPELADAA